MGAAAAQQRQTRAVTEYLAAPYEAAKPNPDRKGAEGDLAVRPLFGLDGQLPSVGSVCR